MPNKMLIDASHPEETRVVVVRGNRIEEFDFESQDKKQLKGNIYLARVTRVEPSLQAAFVEYGGNRHGFLAFSEIHPDYYQIPVADRQALLRAEAEAAQEEARAEDEAGEDSSAGDGQRGKRRRRGGRNRQRGDEQEASTGEEAAQAAAVESDDVVSEERSDEAGGAEDDASDDGNSDDRNGADGNGNGGGDDIESVGAEDALEEARERRRPVRRQYKIQEVVKRRQILLVQVVKEERGNKGAALTTYLSLAGRYSVLMPNTARGGGISRKITNAQNRKRLKEIVRDLDVPQGMGVILRTAGEARTKAEIKRDYEYLMRLWDNVRELTLKSTAPALVYEEGSLIKRSVRDLYNKDIDEIQVAGEEGYREAKDFMRMLMPSHAKVVQPYRENAPIFARSGIEAQLDKMLQPQVTLKSGGYIIINQTEALVAIDVNSGRSTREHSIEDTALQTNLEAADEVARQLRLRDLAGLIVIDFIDMEENRNNRAVEKRLKDCLKNDRARIQVGRISHFGLLEMSRQRIRASVLESTTQTCPHCGGAGHVRSESSVALMVIRAIEEFLLKDARNNITVRTPVSTAIYVLNHKRATLAEMEMRFGLRITVEADDSVHAQHYVIAKGAPAERPAGIEPPPLVPYPEDEDEAEEAAVEADAEPEAAPEQRHAEDGERKRRRRRRRRGGRDRDRDQEAQPSADTASELAEPAADFVGADGAEAHAEAGEEHGGGHKKRRRGKRGGRRGRGQADSAETAAGDAVAESAEDAAPAPEEVSDHAVMKAVEAGALPETVAAEAPAEEKAPAEKKARKPRASRAKAKPVEQEVEHAVEDLEGSKDGAQEQPPPEAKPARRRAPRRKAAAEDAVTETASSPADSGAGAGAAAADEAAEAPSNTPEEAPAPRPEPVVVSESASESEEKPRKTGWWQRKGFL